MFVIPELFLRNQQLIHPGGGTINPTLQSFEAMAETCKAAGTSLIHVMDLDITPAGHSPNESIIQRLMNDYLLNVQIEGTIKSVDTIERYLALGCSRVVLGSIAYQKPQLLEEACRKFPGKIAVHIDVKAGRVVIKGWTVAVNKSALDFAQRFHDNGVSMILYADSDTNTNFTEESIQRSRDFVAKAKMPVLHTTEPATMEQVDSMLQLEKFGLGGFLLGKSLYDNRFDLKAVTAYVEEWSSESGDEPTLIPD